MKKLLALLLAIVMIFTLCACGNNDDDDEDDDKKGSQVQDDDKNAEDEDDDKKSDDEVEDSEEEDEGIVGKWTGKLDLWKLTEATLELLGTDEIDDALLDAMKDMYNGVDLTITFTFDEDGEVTIKQDIEKAFEELIKNLIDNPDILVDYMVVTLEASGATEDDFEEHYGMTVSDYVDSMIESGEIYDYFGEQENVTVTVDYTFDGEDVIMTDQYGKDEILTVDLDGNKMTIENYEYTGSSDQALTKAFAGAIFEGLTLTRK